MATVFLSDDDDLFDIRRDNVFKAVFARDTPESMGALSKLVSALIGRDISIVSLLANEPPSDNIRDRQIRYDLNCRAENGELIAVEMCLNPTAFELERLEFYLAKLFIGQDIRGREVNYGELKLTYQIAILAKENFFDDNEFLHTFEYYDSVNKVSLDGKSRIVTLELSKLDEIVEKPIDEMTASERWAVFFEYLTHKEKRSRINEILSYEEGIAMAGSVLVKVSKDEEERARIMRDEKIELDWANYMAEATRKGHREGLEEGRVEGRAEGEQKIIDLLKSGKTPEEIIKEYGNI